MAKYIERKARYIDIKKVTIPRGFFNQDLNVPKLFDWLYSQPTADVVEVVRCKNCEHRKEVPDCQKKLYSSSCVACSYHSGLIMDGNDFCSYGKRKEGAE